MQIFENLETARTFCIRLSSKGVIFDLRVRWWMSSLGRGPHVMKALLEHLRRLAGVNYRVILNWVIYQGAF